MITQLRVADRYELMELLGEGGMGVVYRALDTKTKSYVALKTMRDASDPVAVELFAKEWGLLAGLSHPNIVDIRDVGEIEEQGRKKPFFVMPLLPGATLAQLVAGSSPRLTVERVVGIIMQVCRGLQVAHEHGLIHRDIKPSNIFVMEDDTAKLIDFGVVHLAGTHSVTGHKGTWQYMAPEQVELKPATPSSDLFSLGVVCYETLTGRKPFARKTPAETADAVRNHIPPPVSEINPAVSQPVSMVVHKAMAKQAIHRFPTARDFADTLYKAFHNQPIDRFDRAKIQPRIERARKAFTESDYAFASEILTELEAEGHIDQEITLLRAQIDQATRQKKIRQLLESARTRVEQDEIPLALAKVQEILEIDPENTDALAMRSFIEKQRNARQIESWMTLARRHLERRDFTEARQAVREVLKIRPAEAAALELLAEADRREQESLRIRAEKEQMYSQAMRAYQNGEMSSALSKLERILELGKQMPDAAVPDRDAVYLGFYNQVRSERDTIQNAYEDARRHLAEKDFPRALEICDEFIAKYPNDALFQALKLEAVEQQRQELSAYIAEIGRRVDAESDFDRKVNILKEACERYPAEQQFEQSLKLTRERRDLVLSIVARARQYEEKDQFAEAIGQWDILRNIYPRYPGIDYEVAQLVKRREAQSRDESKARIVEQVDRALEAADFSRARDLAAGALVEHPGDQELAGLERLARQGVERTSQARELCAQAQKLAAANLMGDAVDALRQASELDPRNPAIREALVDALVDQARPLVETDAAAAEPLVQQACELDPAHPGARGLRSSLADARRKEFVTQCLAEARELQSSNPEAALSRVEGGLALYPNDMRLAQLQATLQNAQRDVRRRQERSNDVEALRQLRQQVDRKPAPGEWPSILERTETILGRHPDDPEIGAVAAEIHQWSGAPQPTAQFSPTAFLDSAGALPPAAQEPKPPTPATQSAPPASPRGAARRAFPFSRAQAATATAVVLVGALIPFLLPHHRPPTPAAVRGASKPPALIDVQLQVTPPDATVLIDGQPPASPLRLNPAVTHDVTVSRFGYQTFRQPDLRPAALWAFPLQPEPVHVRVYTAEKAGQVMLDNDPAAELSDGALLDLLVPSEVGTHTLTVRGALGLVLDLTFQTAPATRPTVSAIKTPDLLAVSSLGSEAAVYSASPLLRANLAGQPPAPIPPTGLVLSGIPPANSQLSFNSKDQPDIPIETGNAPVLYVSLHSHPNAGILLVTTHTGGAHLFIDGQEVKPRPPGSWTVRKPPGTYSVKLTADGYQDFEQQVTLARGATEQLKRELTARPLFSSLVVENGTPLAEVIIEGSRAEIDASGAANIAAITPGHHRIAIHKDYFEPALIERDFTAGQPVTLGAEARLKEFGSFTVRVASRDAQLTWRRADQQDRHPVKSGDSVHVPEGRYVVEAHLGGELVAQRSINVVSGKAEPLDIEVARPVAKKAEVIEPPPLPALPSLFGEPARIEQENGWWHIKGPAYAFLKPGLTHFNVTFPDPGKGVLGIKKNVEWVVDFKDQGNKVVYVLSEGKLTRTRVADGISGKTTSHPLGPRKDVYTISLDVQRERIVVSAFGFGLLDSYISEGPDLTAGKIGFRGNTLFTISR